MLEHLSLLGGLLTTLAYVLGWISAYGTIMNSRTSQGAIAWSLSLCTFPFVALPLYWLFGRTKFLGYVDARRTHHQGTNPLIREVLDRLPDCLPAQNDLNPDQRVLETLAAVPFTHLNQVDLLRNGDETFAAVFKALGEAKDYILLQFYIYRDDRIGRDLLEHLRQARERNVRVYFLYDGIGSSNLSNRYLRDLKAIGVEVSAFRTALGSRSRFQINFRNHRKIVIVDGRVAFIGGLNVGDEYLGRSSRFGHWRDTHCRVQGPSVLTAQLAFASDWFWAQKVLPEGLHWTPIAAPDRDEHVLIVPSGPADSLETWKMLALQAIRQADDRLWWVSPYFVPDSDIVSSLQLAALRGVDVRILLPEKADHLLVWLASFTYLPQMNLPNLRFFRYTHGFLHQKVILVDDEMAVVGTANADNRSFRLNFEISVVGISPPFIKKVEEMLLEDFQHGRPSGPADYQERGLRFRFAAQVSRLFAPIL